MAVKIRLSRAGTTNRPFYRVVVMDSRKKRDGAHLANIGTYDPIKGTIVQFHENTYQEWLSKGALSSDSVKKIYKLYKKTAPALTVHTKSVHADKESAMQSA